MVCKGSSWPVPPKRYLSSATWLVAHVIKCYFLLIDTPIAFRYLSTYSHVQNPTYKKGDTHTHTNIMLVEITPYGLSCTYVHVSEFTDFWREALTCTYVHVSMHIQHTVQRLYHAIYGSHDRTQWFRSSTWMVSSWGLHRTFKN